LMEVYHVIEIYSTRFKNGACKIFLLPVSTM
jgi:hypothetical protein